MRQTFGACCGSPASGRARMLTVKTTASAARIFIMRRMRSCQPSILRNSICLLARRGNDRQQDVRLAARSAMDRDLAAENLGGPVARVVVLEGPDASEDRAQRAEPRRRPTRIFV